MASVLEFQALDGGSTSALKARSTISIYRCGKNGHSTISGAWCVQPVVGPAV